MAVPERRTSKSKRDSRRAHTKLTVPNMVNCEQCGELKLPHHVCKVCGSYKGKDVISQ